jgi:hypothetical protein
MRLNLSTDSLLSISALSLTRPLVTSEFETAHDEQRIKAAQGDAMKWLKEKPQQVVKLEQNLEQVREKIAQLKAHEKELVVKLKQEELKQGALTRSKMTQAKLLAGELLMGLWEERLEGKEELRRHINERVTKPAERDLFGEGFWNEGGKWKVLDKKQERRRWIIVGALFLDLIDFDNIENIYKLNWENVRPFFNWALYRNDHRILYGLKKLSRDGLIREIIKNTDPGFLTFY